MAEDIKLSDVFDMDFLQDFQDSFARAAGMTAVTVDKDGKPITRPTDWSEFCMKYTRGSAEGCRRCEQCDKNGGETAARTGKPAVYECHAGLMDFGAPIIVDGHQIGSILGGQILNAPPDEDKFRAYAKEIGVDPEKYVEAVRKIQIMPRERLEHAAQTLFLMASFFSKMGHYRFELRIMTNYEYIKTLSKAKTVKFFADKASNEMTKNIGRKIADHLSRQGLSQRDLAQRVGVSEVAMSRYINGTRIPKATILDGIAKALHTSMEELMGQEVKDNPEKCYHRVQREIYQFKDNWTDKQKLNLIGILSTL